eukprot:CAMPEP_0118642378 /NCGR_PEP_ID=MMETSP0785-20121206/5803_1 /TAXON_ID=91992 /ORGANISM="Bolidomonas pacifica, Strain CCMP 1866" /LENGTH=202 /DNA_ID=CAMNT_0006533925 /DNA_START=685 /DNA_END=1293 /DNA_ORIENTATION=-
MERRFQKQNNLIIMMILAILGMLPLPLVFGVIRMVKNLFVGLVCGKEKLTKDNSRREWRKERLGIRRRRSWGLGIMALFCIILAKYCRDKDTGYLCLETWGPHHFMQAHAIWHCGCAFAVLFVYLFLRSEVFNMYSYISKYEGEYKGEPMNWLERQIDVIEDMMEERPSWQMRGRSTRRLKQNVETGLHMTLYARESSGTTV